MTHTPAAPAYLTLRRPLAAPFPMAEWPQGFTRTPLSPSLARPLHGLLRRAYAQGGGSVVPDWLDWWEGLAGDSEFEPALCFVALHGDSPAGLCLCWSSGFVKDLVVDPPHHGRGLGTALLATALATLAARGLPEARLKVWADNLPARRLYARLGFA